MNNYEIIQLIGVLFVGCMIIALGFFWLRDPEKPNKKHS
jgi:hypothetical protein